MPFIPQVQSQIDARSLRTQGRINVKTTPDTFGAQIGRGVQNLAAGVDAFASGFDAYMDGQQKEKVANAVAQTDFTPREMEIRNETPEDGKGYRDKVVEEYKTYVNEQAENIDDPVARTEYKNRMLSKTAAVSRRSAIYESTIAAQNSKLQADASLTSLNNKIMTQPTDYDDFVNQGIAVIDARQNVTPSLKAAMKEKWKTDSANSRFIGMLGKAKSVEDIDRISEELVGDGTNGTDGKPGRDWSKELGSGDFERLANKIGSARKAFITKADTDARAALDTIEDRAKDVNTLLPESELAAVQRMVKKSQNPITLSRMARVMRDQEVIKESRNATPAEMRGRINGASGNPGAAYPGLPSRLSGAVNRASKKFGVSAAYLGSTIHREYGQHLKRKAAGVDKAFVPKGAHKGVDLRNVRPDVVDAATVAGKLFGSPLTISSGHRSAARQHSLRFAKGKDPDRSSIAKKSHHTSGTGLDVSTVGMSEEQRAALAGALVDAGFTGIGEYDTHIHADFRNAVPASFGDKEGRSWGGWTYLSPKVAKALVDRGFKGGASGKALKRSSPVEFSEDIDYGQGTSLKKPDGTPASSALGVMQFLDGTFLDLVKKPGMAAKIGVDIEGLTDAQILSMRKDPDIAVMAGAAFASENQKVLSRALGRSASDPELYMAHFLGAGGAVTFLAGMDSQPDQAADKLLPEAAKHHRKMFYKDGKPRTVREVHGKMVRQFSANPSQVAHGDNDTRKRVLKRMEKRIKDDPISHAQESGTFTLTELADKDGFAARGAEAKSIADYYNIPQEDMKPFTEDEAASFSKAIKEGTADDVLELVSSIQAMGSEMANAALRQVGEKDSVIAYAAGMQYSTGQSSVAGDIIRGQKRMDENPDIKSSTGAEKEDLREAFQAATGGALLGAAPKQRQAIKDAALAHYVETVTARGGMGAFDKDAFTNSVQAVMGGKQGQPALAEVNGHMTVLPAGVTSTELETALNRMTVDDWVQMSDTKTPPRYGTGEVVAPDDLASEGRLQAIGGGKYQIFLEDGSQVVTDGPMRAGRLPAYVFTPEADEIEEVAQRPVPVDKRLNSFQTPDSGIKVPEAPGIDELEESGMLTKEQADMLRDQYKGLNNYDENGRWVSPK